MLQEIVQDGRQGPKAALKDLARQGAEEAEGLAEQAQQRLRERVAEEYGAPLDPVSCLLIASMAGSSAVAYGSPYLGLRGVSNRQSSACR